MEEEGLREGVCRLCGETARESIPTVEPEPEAAPEQADGSGNAGAEGTEDDANGGGLTAPFIAASAALIALAAAGIVWAVRVRKK